MNVEMAVPITAKTTMEPRFWKKLPCEEGEKEVKGAGREEEGEKGEGRREERKGKEGERAREGEGGN